MNASRFIAIVACLMCTIAHASAAIEHTFDTGDATGVKNQIVSAMLDAGFTLIEDTQYKLTFAKPVNLHTMHIEGKGYGTPGVLQVPFTVVLQAEKTRVSVFCHVTAEDPSRAFWAEGEQNKYDDWLKEFFPRITAKIEGKTPAPAPSPANH